MELVLTSEDISVNSKGEAEIRYYAPEGIDSAWVINDSKTTKWRYYLKINKDAYNYLQYVPIVKFANEFVGERVMIQYKFERFTSQIGIMIDEQNHLQCLSNFKNSEYSFISFNKSGGIKKSKFNNIYSSLENKPGGGLWASMYTPDKHYISAWQLYIDAHRKEGISPRRASRCAVLFNLKDNSKIPVIDSWEDYQKLSNAFSYKKIYEKMNKPLPDDIPGDLIDYELMSMLYDGIYVTKNGILNAGDVYWTDDWWNMVHLS